MTYIMVSQDQGTNTNTQLRCAIVMGTSQISTRPNYNLYFQTTSQEGITIGQDFNGSSWGRYINTNQPPTSSARNILIGTSANTFTTIHRNGTSLASNTTAYTSPYSNVPMSELGIAVSSGLNNRVWGGYMYEVMIYNSAISVANRQLVEGWLAWKWGLQASLVAGHPYKLASP